ncbi:MAG: GspE/PulE family protein, partial [Janthinobacterium lividum]
RRPQDGKIRFRKYGPLDIELRVATLPTAGGLEDIVLRLLAVGEPVPLAQLGILPANLARLKHLIEKPHGIFFVCGPTGAGKTTTMHSLLQHLNRSDTKIWTAEDPVEITQKGLRQVQVNRKTGLDFATVMRAFLRADPDIIMVGEMRDRETVAIGIEASLTGHLVFATLHTNSAPESIQRLLDMGMDPYNFSDALLGILAQRLARRLCSHCKQAYHPTDDELHLLASEYCEERLHGVQDPADRQSMICATVQTWKRRHHRQAASAPSGRAQATPGNADALRELDALLLYRAVGCGMCSGGYAGRIGLHELMAGTEHLKQLIARRAPHAALMATALQDGMMTLKMDGVEKVLAGETDLNQVRHVCTR